MNLLDVNVWIAGLWERHVGHDAVRRWRLRAGGPLALCRVTQMAILRHVTNKAVLGSDVLTRREAWSTMAKLQSDSDVVWLNEPERLDEIWRLLSARDDHHHQLWTDDYLAAFAQAAGARLVTLDRALGARYPSVHVETI